MGFKSILNLKLDSIPTELAFWMVQNYNTDTSTLNVGKRVIHITPDVVHKVIGIPLGTIPIQEKRPGGKDAVVAEWIKLKWCDYIIKCLNKSKIAWNPSTHFNDPLALLAFVVVNDINERAKRKSDRYAVEWVCKTHLKNIENYMKPRGKTKVEKKTKDMKNKSKQAKAGTKLVENIESNTKQYLAICNEYMENEENDIMISESGNHLILPAVLQVWLNNCTPPEDDDEYIKVQFDAKEETENEIENNEDNVSSEATETDHEAEQNIVIVKDKNEDCEFDNEEKRTCLLSGALVEYEEYFNRVHILVSKAMEEYPNSNKLEHKENEWNILLKKTYDCCVTFMEHINSKGGRKMEDGWGKNTMKNPEVVDSEVIIMNLEYHIKRLKDEVEASKLRETTLVKENTNIKSERDMVMQRNEELENMLKQLQLERDLQNDINNLCNDDLESKSVEKSDAQWIEEWTFNYKTNRFCMKRRNVSLFYLNSIKEVLDLPIGDIKQMIHLKDDEKNISSKEQDTILCIKRNLIFADENIQPHYDQTPNTDTFGKSKENFSSQISHDVSHDDEPNEIEEDSGEVDINKLIKENNILDEESEKTLAGSRIGVSNVLSPLTITVVEKVEDDMGKKQREERKRKLSEKFYSPYVDRDVSLTEKITGLEGNIANYLFSAYASEWY
ncbi:hypothetical protein L1987_85930 [Smallanthus sonchifolius]|uniref:Uncharacterized protein n=1 Tax=Smallanthus sonchifolius TaxID=185202 RepID=A0ACB8XZH5_9ASTR|nr:hypothetical protein L1987_85930 [Smallanthus sonchifolius]